MKKYIKATDLVYTDPSGRDRHYFMDIADTESVRRVLREAVNDEFADRFCEELEAFGDTMGRGLMEAEEDIEYIDSENDDLGTALSAGVEDLRSILNQLAEMFSDDNDVSDLIGRAFGYLDTAEECHANISGGIYDLKVALGLEKY